MYITEIDLGGHGECAECNLGTYRFEKPSKNQPEIHENDNNTNPYTNGHRNAM